MRGMLVVLVVSCRGRFLMLVNKSGAGFLSQWECRAGGTIRAPLTTDFELTLHAVFFVISNTAGLVHHAAARNAHRGDLESNSDPKLGVDQ